VNAELVLGPEDGLGEIEHHGRFGILTLARAAAGPSAPGGTTAEEGVEEIRETAGREPSEGVSSARAGAPQAGHAEHVVLPAPLGITQGLVGQVDLLETLLGLGVPRLGIGVQLPGQAEVGLLYLVGRRVLGDAE
jgi:hypothetical protein